MAKEKKKIVLLQHYYNEIGGIETFLLNFCKKFGKAKIHIANRELT